MRPLASGELSIVQGLMFSIFLASTSLVLGAMLEVDFFVVLIAYVAITVSYTFLLKRIVIVDVLVLACLYCTRVIAGGVAAEIPVSFWLLSMVFTLFASLSVLKRYAEVSKLRAEMGTAPGRGYSSESTIFLLVLGLSTGLMSIVVLMSYLHLNVQAGAKGEEKYALLVVVLYWVAHIWWQAVKGKVGGDPVFFAIRDKVSIFVVILVILIWIFPGQDFRWLV